MGESGLVVSQYRWDFGDKDCIILTTRVSPWVKVVKKNFGDNIIDWVKKNDKSIEVSLT